MNRSTTLAGFLKSATIRATEFRAQLGEYLLATSRARQSFLIMIKGKPVARLVPPDDITILDGGPIRGELPATYRRDLGDNY